MNKQVCADGVLPFRMSYKDLTFTLDTAETGVRQPLCVGQLCRLTDCCRLWAAWNVAACPDLLCLTNTPPPPRSTTSSPHTGCILLGGRQICSLEDDNGYTIKNLVYSLVESENYSHPLS